MNALVLGAKRFDEQGGFGKWHVKCLASLRTELPINEIFVARTSEEAAQQTAEHFRKELSFPDIYGVKISGSENRDLSRMRHDLAELIDRTPIHYASVASKDKCIGDTIHIEQAKVLLDFGLRVLVEKPLCEVDLQGNEAMEQFYRWNNVSCSFGMNLPFAVIREELLKSNLKEKLERAKILRAMWVTQGTDPKIAKNLILHPLSLFMGRRQPYLEADSFFSESLSAGRAVFELYSEYDGNPICDFTFGYGKPLLAFALDREAFEIRYDRTTSTNSVVKLGVSLDDFAAGKKGHEEVVLTVQNPLRMLIKRSITGNPVVTYGSVRKMQDFLFELYALKNAF